VVVDGEIGIQVGIKTGMEITEQKDFILLVNPYRFMTQYLKYRNYICYLSLYPVDRDC
jgi:hypothetical protein